MHQISPSEFAAKWANSSRPERAASQEHFNDICAMLEIPTPNQADPTGDWYAFEKGASKSSGGDGFADVWKRAHFAWEYKGKRKDLAAAYQQLLQYREALENPPLLVVSDLDRFEIHTNFTGTAKAVHTFSLNDLATAPQEPMRLLRCVRAESGFRYTPTTTFETFAFPCCSDEQSAKVSQAAKYLNDLRDRVLNPAEGRPAVTLTQLYNNCPTWLSDAHAQLDEAVFSAYGWPPEMRDEEILARLLDLNFEREPA